MSAAQKMDARVTRKKLGLNQQAFWSRIGVTQSGGSRYEAGRGIPKPVQKLMTLAFGTKSAADKMYGQLRGDLPQGDVAEGEEVNSQSYYTVMAGATKETAVSLSGPVSNLSKALLYYNEAAASPYLVIEYHVSLTEKYILQPDRVTVTVG